MGTLLHKHIASEHADWYFNDAYFTSSGGVKAAWQYQWPNTAYPAHAAINADEMLDNKIHIRKWVEQNDVGTVIYEYVRKSYRVQWGKHNIWDTTSEITNCWEVFYFEDSESALAFSLRFSNLVRPITEDHPTRHYGERYKA